MTSTSQSPPHPLPNPSSPSPQTARMLPGFPHDVFGFPSTGGILTKPLSRVERYFLSLPIDVPVMQPVQRSSTQEDEDKFCKRLRMIGARLYPSMGGWMRSQTGDRTAALEDDRAVIEVGWPEGEGETGVWIVKFTTREDTRAGFRVLREAWSMTERCRRIEELGGRFYEDVRECPELKEAWAF